MAEIKNNGHLKHLDYKKQAAMLDILSPDTGKCKKPPYKPFTLKAPLLESASNRLTNFSSIRVLQSADSVSLILHMVLFP